MSLCYIWGWFDVNLLKIFGKRANHIEKVCTKYWFKWLALISKFFLSVENSLLEIKVVLSNEFSTLKKNSNVCPILNTVSIEIVKKTSNLVGGQSHLVGGQSHLVGGQSHLVGGQMSFTWRANVI